MSPSNYSLLNIFYHYHFHNFRMIHNRPSYDYRVYRINPKCNEKKKYQ